MEVLVSNSTAAELWALQGDAYHALSDPDNALQAYRKASEAAPLVARHHLRQGQLCRETGHLDQALVHFNRAVELQQTPAEGALAHFEIARIFETRRQLDRALQAYQDAIARDSANPDYLFHAGLVQKQVGDYTSAEQLFDQSVRLARKNLEARRQLAAVKALRLINESPVAPQI